MERLALGIGSALRRARLARGLTLREVASASGGRFKATSVAGYERGERSISLERFCDLSRLYGIPPERLLADILLAAQGGPEPEIDITLVESLDKVEGTLVSGFIRQVRTLRSDPPGETIVLRAGDLEVLATAAGKRPEEMMEILQLAPRHEE